MDRNFEQIEVDFERKIEYCSSGDWYIGSVSAYLKRCNEKLPDDSLLGRMFGERASEIYCQFTVGISRDHNDGSRKDLLFSLDFFADRRLIASAKKVYSVSGSSGSEYRNHNVNISIADILRGREYSLFLILENAVQSIIEDYLKNACCTVSLSVRGENHFISVELENEERELPLLIAEISF